MRLAGDTGERRLLHAPQFGTVVDKTAPEQVLLCRREELALVRPVHNQEGGDQRNESRDSAFDDEDPAPCRQAVRSAQLGDRIRKRLQ